MSDSAIRNKIIILGLLYSLFFILVKLIPFCVCFFIPIISSFCGFYIAKIARINPDDYYTLVRKLSIFILIFLFVDIASSILFSLSNINIFNTLFFSVVSGMLVFFFSLIGGVVRMFIKK